MHTRIRSQVVHPARVLAVCGLCAAAPGDNAAVWNQAPSQPDTGLPVEFSFDPQGPFDHAGLTKVDEPSPHAAADWPFTSMTEQDLEKMESAQHAANLARVAARTVAFAPEATPNYFYYWDVRWAMTLDRRRLAVRVDGAVPAEAVVAAAEHAAGAAGIPLVPGMSRVRGTADADGVRRWVLLALNFELAGEGAASAWIDALGAHGAVAFASPVFVNEESDRGHVFPTPTILCRVREDLRSVPGTHLAAVAEIAPELEVSNPALGTMDGAAGVRYTGKNGFGAMAAANRLMESGLFSWSEPDFVATARPHAITPNDGFWGQQWHHRQASGYDMDTDWAWEFHTFGRSAVRSLVLDSGVQTNHPDLNWGGGRDFTSGVVGGVGNGSPVYQCDNHGTPVAGCIAQRGNNFEGSVGTAPGTTVLSGKVGLDDENPSAGESCDPSWSMTADGLINAISWGIGQGVKVTNSSFSRWPSSPGSEDQYTSAATQHQVSNFASTGNDSEEGINWPSSAPFMNAIGNLTSTGARNSSSNWGSGIDFTAPGTGILTTDRTGNAGYVQGHYTFFGGTSAASPNAAGVAALLYSAFPWASRAQVYAAVRDGCQDTGASGYDIYYGHGRVRAYASVSMNTPAGDLCTSPVYCGGYSYNPPIIDTTWATDRDGREPLASCESGGAGESSSVFFWYLAPTSGLLSVNTNGSNYDTVLSIFTGCGTLSATGASLNSPPLQLACDDDSGTGLQSQITDLYLDDAQIVLIKVSKFGTSGGGGNLDFNLSFVASPPPNDLCGGATAIPLTTFGSWNPPTYGIEQATRSTCDGSETCGTPGTNQRSVWYSFTPPTDGIISIDTSGSTYDTVLHVYQGASCPLLIAGGSGVCLGPTQVACDDNSGTGSAARISNLTVVAGQAYKFKVSQRAGGGTGGRLDFNFTYGSVSVPANNACSAAIVLSNSPGAYTLPDLVTLLATRSTCDPDRVCGDPAGDSNSVWYRITPAQDSLFSASTSGSSYDTVLSVHRGGCPLQLIMPDFSVTCAQVPPAIACHDNISTSDRDSEVSGVRMFAGAQYLVMVSDRNPTDAGGNLVFGYTISPWCKADFNGVGGVSTQDLYDYFTAWNSSAGLSGPALQADINNSGGVTTQDIYDFLQLWMQGCE